MPPDPIERQLRRINRDTLLPRAWIALACLALLVPAVNTFLAGRVPLLTGMAILVLGTLWLRRYRQVRPDCGEIMSDVAVGAFLGGWIAGLAIDPPHSLQAWLQAPGLNGGPAAILIVFGALIEDLLREPLRRLRSPR